jgi:hypothetical protein
MSVQIFKDFHRGKTLNLFSNPVAPFAATEELPAMRRRTTVA